MIIRKHKTPDCRCSRIDAYTCGDAPVPIILDESEGRMKRFWDRLFKDSLRIGAYRIEEINDTWAVMRDGQLPEDTTYKTQQEAVDYAVAWLQPSL